jgi:hypothetical protein
MTATNRRATVTKQYDFAAVSEPYTATIYDGAVTNRHVISYPLGNSRLITYRCLVFSITLPRRSVC